MLKSKLNGVETETVEHQIKSEPISLKLRFEFKGEALADSEPVY